MQHRQAGKSLLPFDPQKAGLSNNLNEIIRRLDEVADLIALALLTVAVVDPDATGTEEDTGEDPGVTLPVMFGPRFAPVVFTRHSVPNPTLGGTAYTKDKTNKFVSAAVGETKRHRLETYSNLASTSAHVSRSGFGDVTLDPSTWTSTGDGGRLTATNGSPFKGVDAFGDPIWYIDVDVTNSATDRSASDTYCLELSFSRTSSPGPIPAPGIASLPGHTTRLSPFTYPATAVYTVNPGTGPL